MGGSGTQPSEEGVSRRPLDGQIQLWEGLEQKEQRQAEIWTQGEVWHLWNVRALVQELAFSEEVPGLVMGEGQWSGSSYLPKVAL